MYSLSTIRSTRPGLHRLHSSGAWAWLAPPPPDSREYRTWIIAARDWADMDTEQFAAVCGVCRRTHVHWTTRRTTPTADRLHAAWAVLVEMADVVIPTVGG